MYFSIFFPQIFMSIVFFPPLFVKMSRKIISYITNSNLKQINTIKAENKTTRNNKGAKTKKLAVKAAFTCSNKVH